MYDKNDQHNTVFDSYNLELASTKTKMLTFENAASTYNVFNGVKCDTSDEHDKYLLCCQFLVYVCDGCNVAPLTDYANNVVYQKLSNEKDHFSSLDKKLYTDLRRSKGYTSEL